MVLYLPFDDPEGSKAYDFSQYRNDAELSNGAGFTKDSAHGKALALNITGECSTVTAIPLSGNFTLMCYVKSTTDLVWLINYSGLENYRQGFIKQSLANRTTGYIQLVFVKEGTTLKVYAENQLLDVVSLPEGSPTGFTLNDFNLAGSEAQVDDLKVFNKAMSFTEIRAVSNYQTDVEYYINGKNFKDFAVEVSKSAGLVGGLAKKSSLEVDWDDYHGTVKDTSNPRYKDRTITLQCFIQASSRSQFVSRVREFFNEFEGGGTKRFVCEYDGDSKPLVYEVTREDEADPDKTWGKYNEGLMVGTFTLKLVEYNPVKRVLRHIGSIANTECVIDFTSYKMVDIYWGDGSMTPNVSGSKQHVVHNYPQPGQYDVIMAGVIEDITDFSTNDIVIWDNLH